MYEKEELQAEKSKSAIWLFKAKFLSYSSK